MSKDEQQSQSISPRTQAVARATAGVLAGAIAYLVVTVPFPTVGWAIAREPVPFLPPPRPELFWNEAVFGLTALLVYTVLSFWAAMD